MTDTKSQTSARDNIKQLWRKAKTGSVLTGAERDLMINAYWSGDLPKDPDYSVAQWVEDGMPQLP